MTFSAAPRRLNETVISDAVVKLQMMIFDAIIGGLLDELVVDLSGVTLLLWYGQFE